jgi:hypothetical protein
MIQRQGAQCERHIGGRETAHLRQRTKRKARSKVSECGKRVFVGAHVRALCPTPNRVCRATRLRKQQAGQARLRARPEPEQWRIRRVLGGERVSTLCWCVCDRGRSRMWRCTTEFQMVLELPPPP